MLNKDKSSLRTAVLALIEMSGEDYDACLLYGISPGVVADKIKEVLRVIEQRAAK